MFDQEFLNLEHAKLYDYLIQLFKKKKDSTDCFLHHEYIFTGHDRYSLEKRSVGLWDQLKCEEKIQLDKKVEEEGPF